MSVQDAQYLVNKYGSLSTEQLADLLASGHTKVETKDGRERELPMHAEERAYVRTLFLRRLAEEGVQLERGAAGASTDADLATAYRIAKSRAERAAQRDGGTNDAAGRDGGAGGSATERSYEDGEGMGGSGSLEEVFGGESEETSDAAGGAGQSAANRDGASGEDAADRVAMSEDEGGTEAGSGEAEQAADKNVFAPGPKHIDELTDWDAATSQLVINDAKKAAYLKKYANAVAPSGAKASLVDVALAQHAAKADETMVDVSLKLTVDIAGEGTRIETTQFYYRPAKNTYDTAAGVGGLAAKFKTVVKLSADGKKAEIVNGGHYADRTLEFTVEEAARIATGDSSVRVLVRFARIPRGWKVRTVEDEWVTPNELMPVRLVLPLGVR